MFNNSCIFLKYHNVNWQRNIYNGLQCTSAILGQYFGAGRFEKGGFNVQILGIPGILISLASYVVSVLEVQEYFPDKG